MAWRLFFDPLVVSGAYRAPKYVASRVGTGSPELAGLQWAMMDYGHASWCLLAADTNAGQQTFLAAQTDVTDAPADLATTIGGGNVQALRDYLEAADIPALWITGGDTWLTVVRFVGGLFQFAQRFASISGGAALLPPGTDKNQTMADMGQAWQTAALATADSFDPPYDVSAITGSTTIRAALKILADQWGSRSFHLGQLTF